MPGIQYRPTIDRIQPYIPGKPIAEVKRELGLTEVIKLASNENPLGPSPLARKAVAEGLHELHIYPDGACTDLKQALAERLDIATDMILVGNGSDEVIKLLAEAYLEPEDEVVFADPTFSEYAYATRLMGAKEVRVPLRDDVHDLDAMAAALSPKTKMVFICNPNNPTGTIVERQAVERFLAAVPAHTLVVFDEAYAEYASSPTFPDSLSYVRAGRNVVVLRTFSKIYGLAALRVGYGVARADIIAAAARVREPFNVNALAQRAAIAALEDVDHVRRSLACNREGMKLLVAELSKLGWRVTPSEANFIFVETGLDAQSLFAALMREGVIVRSGAAFGRPTAIRITIGTESENRRLLEAVARVTQVSTDAFGAAR